MGYYTRVTGELHIEPPLTWAEIKTVADSAFGDGCLDVTLDIREDTVDTDEGPLILKTAPALVPSWDEEYKAYNLVAHVQQAIDAFPGHTFTGRLECEGEESGDLWRVVVRDGRAEKVTPRIVWPDED